MYMFSIFTYLLLYFVGLYVFSSKCKHLLMVLLSLEYIVLSLFMLIVVSLIKFDYDFFFPVVFLGFSVCEGALGLSILVSIISSHGNDFLTVLFYLYVKVFVNNCFFDPSLFFTWLLMVGTFFNVFV